MASYSERIGHSLHQQLRDATRLEHRTLDHHSLLAPLVNRNLTALQYQKILLTLLGIHSYLHERLNAAIEQYAADSSLQLSDRLAWLRADLDHFGIELDRIVNPVVGWQLAPVESIEQLIGEMYVLEGSTLGGQVIYRLLNESLGLNVQSGAAFFYGNGGETMQRWLKFLNCTDSLMTSDKFEDCIFSARILYSNFSAALTMAESYWLAQSYTSVNPLRRRHYDLPIPRNA